MQALYPLISKAPIIPSWYETDMLGKTTNQESGFDLDLVRAEMKKLGVSQSDLAKAMGLNQSAVSNLLRGERQLKVHEAAFIEKFLGLQHSAPVAFVPVIGITSAGNWREAVNLPRRTLPVPPGTAGAHAFAVETVGDSMDLLIREGSFVVVDPDQTQLYSDKVYLIENEDHETQIKLYRSNPARFEPASNNETHKTVMMGECHIRVIGRVVWQGMPL